ncbi:MULTISPECIES: tubulin-like doman-containing protein [Streptomyces]|uniref:Tubulin-like protein n=1 Tax=Streptomyces changanensis TaxID=2964669 RepID=A0ABY5NBN9_9ACTN|nr:MULTISPECIES: tubulin-like doman-containing protein [Streptomyces]UUS33431.1 hypothetical protein NRO40_23215 [Streptomyces changanensis]
MKIYQPMLFVGLGGTGGRIGSELERGLRRELGGPDGTNLVDGGRRAPFQLPDCLQFVYADFSEAELLRQPQFHAKGTEGAAYARTSRMVRDLLPGEFDSSPDVTRMLRVALHEETRDWLPPQARQPRVAPLHNGAGQLPTVGRAALFATLRSGLEPVLRPLRAAIGAIGNSAGDLQRLGGGRIRGCDVFVAFSVAGGTGAGIFYDFIHLIGHEFRRSKVPGVKIYPLVVMPSAFPPEAGGGREAELNAARALVDLSRLVDDQNVPDAQSDVGDVEQRARVSVRYPGDTVVALRPSTVQTAFLFSKPSVIRTEDLRRSVTAMVTSLIGTELPDDKGGGRSDADHQSFAASFINESVERSKTARSGIGYRSMSTSLAASLTVPVDDLAEIVAARLLAQAVRGMAERARHPAKDGGDRVREMFERSGIGALWTRRAPDPPEPEQPPRGTKAVTQALHDRRGDLEDLLVRLERDLARDVPRLVEDFRPAAGARELLGLIGPFRLERVIAGLPGHPDRVAEAGFAGMLSNRGSDPRRPAHVQHAAPPVPRIKGGAGGLVPARWSDPDVREAVADQDDWYRWRANALWHRAWGDGATQWRPPLARARKAVDELARALRAHEEDEGKLFSDRRRELYRDDRKGVSYLLPPQNGLRAFYDDVVDRLVRSERLPDNTDAAGLLAAIVQPEDWLRALDAVRRSHGAAVKEVKQVVERRVKRLFGEADDTLYERPLLPSMALLLRAAAGDENAAAAVDGRWLDQFRVQLAKLLPVGFTPDGSGPLKVLIAHPESEADGRAAEYLAQELYLPPHAEQEFRAVDTESITVVLFRSGMSLTDISEVREVLKLWSEARDAAGAEDFLHWRQRLGHNDDWLVSTEHDRQRILHHLLCAMWNGRVAVHEGGDTSPGLVRVRLQEGDSATLSLRLESYDGRLSGWAGLLRAYERAALLDEGSIIEEFCERLMRTQPEGLSTTPVPPSPLFLTFVEEVAPRELARIEELTGRYGDEDEEWLAPLRHFWAETLPGALALRFDGAARPTRPTLRALHERYRRQDAEDEPYAPRPSGPHAAPDAAPDDGPDTRPGDGYRYPAPGQRPSAGDGRRREAEPRHEAVPEPRRTSQEGRRTPPEPRRASPEPAPAEPRPAQSGGPTRSPAYPWDLDGDDE